MPHSSTSSQTACSELERKQEREGVVQVEEEEQEEEELGVVVADL